MGLPPISGEDTADQNVNAYQGQDDRSQGIQQVGCQREEHRQQDAGLNQANELPDSSCSQQQEEEQNGAERGRTELYPRFHHGVSGLIIDGFHDAPMVAVLGLDMYLVTDLQPAQEVAKEAEIHHFSRDFIGDWFHADDIFNGLMAELVGFTTEEGVKELLQPPVEEGLMIDLYHPPCTYNRRAETLLKERRLMGCLGDGQICVGRIERLIDRRSSGADQRLVTVGAMGLLVIEEEGGVTGGVGTVFHREYLQI